MIVSNSRETTIVANTETAELAVTVGLKWHQIDCGLATAGSLAVNIDFGTGSRQIATIDFTDTERLPILIYGDVAIIELVPTGVDSSYRVVYIASEV